MDESDAEGLRVTLGKALEARDIEEMTVPGGELDYDTIQARASCDYSLRVYVWPAHARGKPANEPPGAGPRGLFARVRGIWILRTSRVRSSEKSARPHVGRDGPQVELPRVLYSGSLLAPEVYGTARGATPLFHLATCGIIRAHELLHGTR